MYTMYVCVFKNIICIYAVYVHTHLMSCLIVMQAATGETSAAKRRVNAGPVDVETTAKNGTVCSHLLYYMHEL